MNPLKMTLMLSLKLRRPILRPHGVWTGLTNEICPLILLMTLLLMLREEKECTFLWQTQESVSLTRILVVVLSLVTMALVAEGAAILRMLIVQEIDIAMVLI